MIPTKGRLADLVTDDGLLPVFIGDVPPEEPPVCSYQEKLGRLIDLITVPIVGLVPVFGQVKTCFKEWEEEVEFGFLDCGDGVPIRMPRELRARFTSFTDCTANYPCPETTLFFEEETTDWRGEIALADGTLGLRFYCEFDPILEEVTFRVDYTGDCVYGGLTTSPIIQECESPPSWVTHSINIECCQGGLQPNPFATLTVYAKNRPVYLARHVDMVNNGGLRPVFAAVEDCEETCPEPPGCCFGVLINDGNTIVTIHSVVQTGGPFDCSSCSGNTVTIPEGSSCVVSKLGPGISPCPVSYLFCLTCDFEQSEYDGRSGWEYYRLTYDGSGTEYEPTSGSCSPLSLTFTNLPWTAPGGPYGVACFGTFSVTITRAA